MVSLQVFKMKKLRNTLGGLLNMPLRKTVELQKIQNLSFLPLMVIVTKLLQQMLQVTIPIILSVMTALLPSSTPDMLVVLPSMEMSSSRPILNHSLELSLL